MAERYWLEAVRLGPGQTRARLNLAALYLNTGRLAEAETYTLESLKIRKTGSALELLGALQDLAGRYDEAAASYEEAVRVGPPSYTIWANIGATYRRLRREGDAVRAFRRGLKEAGDGLPGNPRDAERVAWCAFYHANLSEVAQARSLAAQALAMSGPGPPKGRARKRLVLVYGLIHDIDAALHLLEGAPPDLVKELEHSPELSPELRRDPRFARLTR